MSEIDNIALVAEELKLKINNVTSVARLLEDDATVPFIARYRKEATDSGKLSPASSTPPKHR